MDDTGLAEIAADAKRATIALIRAARNGDHDGIDAILRGTSQPGLMLIAAGLALHFDGMLLRYTAATLAIDDAEVRAIIATAGTAELAAIPGLAGVLEDTIKDLQRHVIAGS